MKTPRMDLTNSGGTETKSGRSGRIAINYRVQGRKIMNACRKFARARRDVTGSWSTGHRPGRLIRRRPKVFLDARPPYLRGGGNDNRCSCGRGASSLSGRRLERTSAKTDGICDPFPAARVGELRRTRLKRQSVETVNNCRSILKRTELGHASL